MLPYRLGPGPTRARQRGRAKRRIVSCLDDNTVAAFLQGLLDDPARASVEQHIDDCESCRNLLSAAVGTLSVVDTGLATRIEGAGGGGDALARSGQRVADRYLLEREIGRGGMAQVWCATDTKLRREVAIKLMSRRSRAAASGSERFEREAMAIARLRSPYVVEIYDYGLTDGCPFIVMEILQGQDLRQRLEARGRLSVAEVAAIVIDTAKGLSVAHEAGIVHRDLKPANIFLHQLELGEEQVKVFDFGVAKMLQDEAVPSAQTTAEGVMVGTPRYMSPEQTHGSKAIDHRSDLWSLGVIAYTALTGRFPFSGEGVGEIMAQITRETPPAPSTIDPELPAALDGFFARALAKDPAERHSSAVQMAAEMADIADVSITLPESDVRPRGDSGRGAADGAAAAVRQRGKGSWLGGGRVVLPVVLAIAGVSIVVALSRGGPQSPSPASGSAIGSGAGRPAQSNGAESTTSSWRLTPSSQTSNDTAGSRPTRSNGDATTTGSNTTGPISAAHRPSTFPTSASASSQPSASAAPPVPSLGKSVDPKDPFPGPW